MVITLTLYHCRPDFFQARLGVQRLWWSLVSGKKYIYAMHFKPFVWRYGDEALNLIVVRIISISLRVDVDYQRSGADFLPHLADRCLIEGDMSKKS